MSSPFKMASFVFWSGLYNALLAFVLLFPPLYRALGLNVCSPALGWLISGFLFYTAAVLVRSSFDLARFGTLVYWESLLRYVAAVVLIPAGLLGDLGGIAAVLGLGDLAIGLTYAFGLTRESGLKHRELLLGGRVDA